jgi:hypothetical protein
MTISQNTIYAVSDDVVAREIEGEIIIVPLVAGIGDLEDELFTLNETGKAIWELLDGRRSLQSGSGAVGKYATEPEKIQTDVLGLVGELLRRGMVIEVPSP